MDINSSSTLRTPLVASSYDEEMADNQLNKPSKESINRNKKVRKSIAREDKGDINSNNTEEDIATSTKARIYSNNQPRIVLEILSARSALVILVLTYFIFVIGFITDAVSLVSSFHNSNRYLGSKTCSSQNIGINNYTTSTSWGCLDGNNWNSTVVGLTNVISVQLNVEQFDFSGLFNYSETSSSENQVKYIYYDIHLYACFHSHGCGDTFTNKAGASQVSNFWNQVLVLNQQQLKISQKDLNEPNYATNGYTITVLDNTFQNQESTPDHGAVEAYFFQVHYYYDINDADDGSAANANDVTNFLVSTDENVLNSIQYTVLIVDRPSHSAAKIVVIILLMACTIGALAYFIQKAFVEQTRKSLPEQRWVIAYLIIVFLFQNAIYCSLYWMKNQSFAAVYASYVLDALGQAGLFTIWLIFSDSIRRKSLNTLMFYVPKIFFGFCIFLVNLVMLTYQFPSIVPYNPGDRNSVESFSNWPHSAEQAYVAFSSMYMLLLWIFVLRWFYLLWLTGRKLRQLPYMGTRYLQLSYRFFLLQATLVTAFYMFEYGYILASLGRNATQRSSFNVVDLANDINTLLREQTQLFGKILFLSVYAFMLAFIFLPSNIVDSGGVINMAANLASTYVITREEWKPLVKSRRKAIHKMNKLQQSLFQQIASYKAEVFCADLAQSLCHLSMEAYYDVPGKLTASGFGHYDPQQDPTGEGGSTKFIEAEKFGYEIVDSTYNEDHDTFCVVLRQIQSREIVVMFRGTASRKHWKDNLNYAKVGVEFSEMTLPELDKIDDLDVPSSMGHSSQTLMQRLASLSPFATMDDADNNSLESDDDSDEENDASHRSGAKAKAEPKRDTSMTVGAMLTSVADATATVVGHTTNLVSTRVANAAAITPGLRDYVVPLVHSGFWNAYSVVREFVHSTLRKELLDDPQNVFFTGHSLGGALATLAALDCSIHTLPRVNTYLEFRKMEEISHRTGEHLTDRKFHRVRPTVYSFGSPKVGNGIFTNYFNKLVPDCFRVVVDGDPVTGVPPGGYVHVGTEILIDDMLAGSIIIDPSFVERWLRTKYKTSVASHSILLYRDSIQAVIDAANFMSKYALCATTEDNGDMDVDTVRLALQTSELIKEDRKRANTMRSTLASSTALASNNSTTSSNNNKTASNSNSNNIRDSNRFGVSTVSYIDSNSNNASVERDTIDEEDRNPSEAIVTPLKLQQQQQSNVGSQSNEVRYAAEYEQHAAWLVNANSSINSSIPVVSVKFFSSTLLPMLSPQTNASSTPTAADSNKRRTPTSPSRSNSNSNINNNSNSNSNTADWIVDGAL